MRSRTYSGTNNLIVTGIIMSMAVLLLPNSGCRKFVEVDPPQTELVRSFVFSDDISANASLEGIYQDFFTLTHFVSGHYNSGVTSLAGMSADELICTVNEPVTAFTINQIEPQNSSVLLIWQTAYTTIYYANAVIEGLEHASGVTENLKHQLQGEAKFLRAFCHFYLVNLFGDIPLITTTDYRDNSTSFRSPEAEVYNQIIDDLKGATQLMVDDYSLWNGKRVRANKWAAAALLARVYLYLGNWQEAEAQATAVIDKTSLYELLDDIDKVFLADNREAILQLLPTLYSPSRDTYEGFVFVNNNSFQAYDVLNPQFLNTFEANDQRSVHWVKDFGSYAAPYKYKVGRKAPDVPVTEESVIMRLAEQYLIRAEARAQQDNIAGAQADINAIRNRAGLGNTTAATKADLLLAIEQERRVELFTEWGHRWLDLKRWGKVDAVIGALKPATWQSTDALYPIPQTELDKNRNLTQNPGY